jgi:hypothetical protein
MVDPFPTFYPGGALGDLTRRVQAIEDAVGTRPVGGRSLLSAVVGDAQRGGLTEQIDNLQQAVKDVGDVVTSEATGLFAVYRSIATGQDYSIGHGVARMATVLEADSITERARSLSERFDDVFQAQLAVRFVDDLVPFALNWVQKIHPDEINKEFPHLPESIQPPINSLVQLHIHNIYPIFSLVWEAAKTGNRETLRSFVEYWNDLRDTLYDGIMIIPIPKYQYLEGAAFVLYYLFSSIARHSLPQ